MTFSSEEKIYIWLDSFPLEEQQKHLLLKEAVSPFALLKDLQNIFPRVIKSDKKGVYNSMLSSLQDGGNYFRLVVSRLEKQGILPIARASSLYPKSLYAMEQPPLVLYAKGNADLLRDPLFAIVGSRITPDVAMRTTKTIAKSLSLHFTLLTGVADGGDRACVEGGLQGSKKVVCIPAGGLDSFPKADGGIFQEVEKHGLLLAFHPLQTNVRNFSYERRNEVLATLSTGVLVVSGDETSGALITAKHAKKQKKPIFALPYPPSFDGGKGCNQLIKQGAFLTDSPNDIFETYHLAVEEETTREIPLSTEEERVVALLQKELSSPVVALAQALGVPAFKLGGVLTSLEVKGLIVRLGGNQVALVKNTVKKS